MNMEVDLDFADFSNEEVSPNSIITETPTSSLEPSPIPPPNLHDTTFSNNEDGTTLDVPLSKNDEEEILGRDMRNKIPSVLLQDFVTHNVLKESPSPATSSPHHTSGTSFPITPYINCDSFSLKHRKLLAAIISGDKPRSFKEAMKPEGWRHAMQEEIRALEYNGTWTMEQLPPGKRALDSALDSQCVYIIKFHADGSIERLKARLLVFGNHQIEGLNYHETCAPVAKMVTVRAFLVVAASKNWELHQMDVHMLSSMMILMRKYT